MVAPWCALTCDDWSKMTCDDWESFACANVVGFDAAAWPIVYGCLCGTAIENLDYDLTRIEECTAIFCGPSDECGVGIHFSPGQYPTIRDWVHNGGRLWCNGEYNQDDTYGGDCLSMAAREQINEFMSALGSSMQIGHHDCNCYCEGDGGYPWIGINGSAELVHYPTTLPGIYHACVGQVFGGTPMNMTQPETVDPPSPCSSSFTWIAIEKVGQGFIVLTGDSNIFAGCDYDNCKIAQRFVNNPPDHMV